MGNKFTVYTDHKPLLYFRNSTDTNSRVSRYQFKLSNFDFSIQYKQRTTNVVADCLSRNPIIESVNIVETRSRTIKTKPVNYKRTRTRNTKPIQLSEDKTSDVNDKEDKAVEVERGDVGQASSESKQNSTDEVVEVERGDAGQAITEPKQSVTDKEMTASEIVNTKSNTTLDPIIEYDTSFKCEKSLIECREKLHMRKDNYLIFVSSSGKPLDDGARQLQARNILPKFIVGQPGEVSVHRRGKNFKFGITLRGDRLESTPTIMSSMQDGIKILKHLLIKYNLESLSVAKTATIEHAQWEFLKNSIKIELAEVKTKIIICNGLLEFIQGQDRLKILEEIHSSAIGGHKGITKTYRRMKTLYFWPNMKKDVRKFVRRCVTCQLKKLVRVKTRQSLVITDTPHSSVEKVCVDIVGPFKATKNGNRNILTIQCNFTKFCVAVAIPDATAETVANAFLKHFICTFGVPSIVLSDQGTCFLSRVFTHMSKAFKINNICTSAYRPQTNGSLERSHHSLAEYLKVIIDKNNEWDQYIEMVMFSYNTSVHEAHEFQPFQLMFGKLPNLPTEKSLELSGNLVTYTDFVQKLCKDISGIQKIAKEKLVESKLKAKYYYDKKVNLIDFKVGESAFLLMGGKQHKLEDQYTGPHKIVEVYDDKPQVKIDIKGKQKVVHSNRLKKSYINAE
ncbi:hypothetical protein TKK_0011363 [Trichogramma kaykai]